MTKESTYPYIFTIVELCMYLRISDKTARKYCMAGEFPNAFKCGKQWRIPKQDVIDFTQTH